MSQQIISGDLVSIALDRVEGTAFERFLNAFYPAIAGVEYIPLGGTRDGGADALFAQGLWEVRGSPSAFLQASVQEEHRSKILSTVRRLAEFGRTAKSLTYVTSRVIPHIDTEEERLSVETGIIIRIRDRRYIAAHINTSHVTTAAFDAHLRPYLAFLNTPGNVPIIEPSQHVQSPAVYVFLRQEVERRLRNSSLIEAVTDGLILWALEDTDPEKYKFMTRDQILARIETTVPPARQFIRSTFKQRLELLASKQNPTGREIRWHRKEDKFSLPYETRSLVKEENIADEALRVRVVEILINRASSIAEGKLSANESELLARVALRALQLTFEKEGLEFTAFLHGCAGRPARSRWCKSTAMKE